MLLYNVIIIVFKNCYYSGGFIIVGVDIVVYNMLFYVYDSGFFLLRMKDFFVVLDNKGMIFFLFNRRFVWIYLVC